MSVDDLRAAAPQVGFVLYAWAGEQVTLEMHFAGGAYHALHGPDEASVVAQAAALFAPQQRQQPDDEPEEDVFA